jgi:hypothetical protein
MFGEIIKHFIAGGPETCVCVIAAENKKNMKRKQLNHVI